MVILIFATKALASVVASQELTCLPEDHLSEIVLMGNHHLRQAKFRNSIRFSTPNLAHGKKALSGR